jgi:hypothetical protein
MMDPPVSMDIQSKYCGIVLIADENDLYDPPKLNVLSMPGFFSPVITFKDLSCTSINLLTVRNGAYQEI